MDDLPGEYDVIIIGTGLAESIIAAAASRIGKTVLHLDSNDYYGGDWASFNLDNLQIYLDKQKHSGNNLEHTYENASNSFKLQNGNSIYNIEQEWHVEDDIDYKWTKSAILKEYRKFNIDLTPKLLFFKGHLIQLLITSNISRYAEFRSVTRVLTVLPTNTEEHKFKLSAVPCSRSDVFATKNVNVVEKRMLMKLLNSCLSYNPNEENEDFKDFVNKTFLSYLKHKKLTDNLIHYVLYAIAMGNPTIDCLDGVSRVKRFLSSLGYYGNTPFLYPMYGNGEISQYFCRLCAVFGGIYCLKRPVTDVIVEEQSTECVEDKDDGFNEHSGPSKDKKNSEKKLKNSNLKKVTLYKEIICGNQHLKSTHLVMGAGFAPNEFKRPCVGAGLSRAIFITDSSVLEDEQESLTLLKIPPIQDFSETTVLEVGRSSYVCPNGLYLVHMTCCQKIDARTDLRPLAEKLFNLHPKFEKLKIEESVKDNSDEGITVENTEEVKQKNEEKNRPVQDRPNVLWSLYFNLHDTSECDFTTWNIPENIFLCGGPDLDLDYDHSVEEARQIFSKMYPDCEFLPRAPDPEEIVFGDPDEDLEKIEENTDVLNSEDNSKDVEEQLDSIKKDVEHNSEKEDSSKKVVKELTDDIADGKILEDKNLDEESLVKGIEDITDAVKNKI